MHFKQLALALVLAGSLTGCGAASTGYAPLGSQTADLSKAESDVLEMLNRSAICKADGSYRVMFLPPGDYVAAGVGTAEARVKIQKLKVTQVDLSSK